MLIKERLFFFVCLLLACAAPARADSPGDSGNLQVVVHARISGTPAHLKDGECVRIREETDHDECGFPKTVVIEAPAPMPPPKAAPVKQVVMAPAPPLTILTQAERTVYFNFDQAEILPQMQERLDSMARILRTASDVRGARIVGYADRIGYPDYNEKLSKLRAEAVKDYLIAHGLINTRVADTHWVGASEPSTDCPNRLERRALIDCLQQDRRVVVEIDYATTSLQAMR